MSERKEGYYWTKTIANSVSPAVWEVNRWDGIMWECGDSDLTDNYFSAINENRLPSPDEKPTMLYDVFDSIIEQGHKFTYDPIKRVIGVHDKPEPRIISVDVAINNGKTGL